jgi:hypothetical protein
MVGTIPVAGDGVLVPKAVAAAAAARRQRAAHHGVEVGEQRARER